MKASSSRPGIPFSSELTGELKLCLSSKYDALVGTLLKSSRARVKNNIVPTKPKRANRDGLGNNIRRDHWTQTVCQTDTAGRSLRIAYGHQWMRLPQLSNMAGSVLESFAQRPKLIHAGGPEIVLL